MIAKRRYRAPVALLIVCFWAASGFGGPPLTHKDVDRSGRGEQTIAFPDSDDLGTGSVRTELPAGALAKADIEPLETLAMIPKKFLMTLSIGTSGSARGVVVVLSDTSRRFAFRRAFALPQNFDPMRRHLLDVSFAEWKVTGVKLDGKTLVWKAEF